MTKRHALIPASYLILMNEKDEVLLARRYQTGYEDGNYGLPAGHVEEGETFRQALIREIGEEIGITIKLEELGAPYILQRDSHFEDQTLRYRIDVFFVVHTWEGKVTNCEREKCDDLVWRSLDDLPENTIPYVRDVLVHIANGETYGEIGYE